MLNVLQNYTNEEIKERAEEIKENLKDYFITDDNYGICVGSWKAYNECKNNSRGFYNALGCHLNNNFYLDPTAFDGCDELEFYSVLYAVGFDFDEMDELFVQDINGDSFGLNCDYLDPYKFIDALNNYNILDDEENAAKIAGITKWYGNGCDFFEACGKLSSFDIFKGTGEEYEQTIFDDGLTPEEYKLIYNSWISSYISIDFESLACNDDIYEFKYNGDDYVIYKY